MTERNEERKGNVGEFYPVLCRIPAEVPHRRDQKRTLCWSAAAFLTFVVALVFAYLCWATGTRLI